MQKYAINAQYTIYMNGPKKTLKRDFATSPEGLSGSNLLRSDDSPDSQMGGWTSCEAAKGTHRVQKIDINGNLSAEQIFNISVIQGSIF
jgi:hypothetical protein